MKLFVALVLMLTASAFAGSVSFEPYMTVWECPVKGVPHPILVCQEHTTNYGTVTVEMIESTEGLEVGWWDTETDDQLPKAYGNFSLIKYSRENGERRMGLILSAGWNAQSSANSQAFLEGSPGHFSDSLMLTSERIPYGEGELLISFGFQNLLDSAIKVK